MHKGKLGLKILMCMAELLPQGPRKIKGWIAA